MGVGGGVKLERARGQVLQGLEGVTEEFGAGKKGDLILEISP